MVNASQPQPPALTDSEAEQLTRLFHKATGLALQQPCRNEPGQWTTEFYAATVGEFRQLERKEP